MQTKRIEPFDQPRDMRKTYNDRGVPIAVGVKVIYVRTPYSSIVGNVKESVIAHVLSAERVELEGEYHPYHIDALYPSDWGIDEVIYQVQAKNRESQRDNRWQAEDPRR